jgi:amidase
LDLQPPKEATLADYRVAVWKNDDIAPVSQEVVGRIETVAEAISRSGGTVDQTARPDFVAQKAHDTYQLLLQATLAARQPWDAYAKMQQDVTALNADDQSDRARTLRLQTATHWEYGQANESRTHLRWAWHEFFKTHDALIAPIMATPAFEHDHQRFEKRTIKVDGAAQPYFQQIFWAGLAICSYLPSTVIPAGSSADGLPIGLQIIGPEFGDLKTIGLARLLEKAGFAFTPPPGY